MYTKVTGMKTGEREARCSKVSVGAVTGMQTGEREARCTKVSVGAVTDMKINYSKARCVWVRVRTGVYSDDAVVVVTTRITN